MVLDKCLLVWLFLLDRLNAIWFCLIIKIKAQYLSICLIQSGLRTACLSLHNVLAVILHCVLLFFFMFFCNHVFKFLLTELVKPTESDFKPLSLLGASSVFRCAIELFLVHFCLLSFGICSLVSSFYSVGDCRWCFYQVLLLPPSCVYQMT